MVDPAAAPATSGPEAVEKARFCLALAQSAAATDPRRRKWALAS
jgi:hypothetical protein